MGFKACLHVSRPAASVKWNLNSSRSRKVPGMFGLPRLPGLLARYSLADETPGLLARYSSADETPGLLARYSLAD